MFSFLLLTLATLSFAAVIDRPERHNHAWEKFEPSDPSTPIQLLFALKQQNVDTIRDVLLEVSTPSNDKYGQHLTMAEAQEMTKPTDETTYIVKNWLIQNGIKPSQIENATPNGDFLRIQTTIGFTEQLLNTHYYDYWNANYGVLVPRVDYEMDYHVPDYIAPYLDFISPTKRFPSPMRINSTYFVPDPDAGVTPSFLHELYNVGNTQGKAPKNIQGVASFLAQYYTKSDVTTFWTKFNLPTANITNVPSNQPSGHGIEAELDVEYITAMGEAIPTQVWYTPGRAPNNHANEPFLTWLTDVESASNQPLLFSISYGEDEKSVGYSYGSRVNTEFAKCGSTGMSFLFASGDSGAGGNCTASKGRENPTYPSGSPYVTSVGGTRSSKPEIVWSSGGGGFSDYWPTQSWQQDAVKQYFTAANGKLPPSNIYNASGRGYPDIAAQAVNYEIVSRGGTMGVSGTSCAAPCASGIFALLNDLRLQNGMSSMGFLNPFIYETAAKDATILNDITSGTISGCGGHGYPAEKGWDAASGFGTPNYGNLAKHVLQTGLKTIKNRN